MQRLQHAEQGQVAKLPRMHGLSNASLMPWSMHAVACDHCCMVTLARQQQLRLSKPGVLAVYIGSKRGAHSTPCRLGCAAARRPVERHGVESGVPLALTLVMVFQAALLQSTWPVELMEQELCAPIYIRPMCDSLLLIAMA
jgi:hypothetical protein